MRAVLLVTTAGCLAVAVLALLYPALYNGFPVTFFDTGGYVTSAYQYTIWPGRSAIYGFFIRALHVPGSLWPVILVQAAVVVWLIHLTARVHRLPSGPVAVAVITVLLAAATGVSWYAAQIMPDIFQPVVVLALYLLIFQRDGLNGWERLGAVLVLCFGIATHMAFVALAGGLIVATFLVTLPFCRTRWFHRLYLTAPAILIGLATLAIPSVNAYLDGNFRFTPGGQAFVFGRLVQDGIVERFLADRCPTTEYQLCEYQGKLPKTADDWMWAASSPFYKLGAWDGLGEEMRKITRKSLKEYPLMHLEAAANATWQQLTEVATGDSLIGWHWMTKWSLESFIPDVVSDYLAARQNNKDLSFDALNQLHVPVAFAALGLCLLLIPILIWLEGAELAIMLGFFLVAILGNAVICGVFANAHDRYGSRIVWLAVFGAVLAISHVFEYSRGRRPASEFA